MYACNAIIRSFLATPLINGTPGEEPLTLWHVLQSLAKYSPYSGSPSKFRISADNSTSSECTKPENNPKISTVEIKRDVSMSQFAKEKFQISIDELESEREAVKHLLK